MCRGRLYCIFLVTCCLTSVNAGGIVRCCWLHNLCLHSLLLLLLLFVCRCPADIVWLLLY